MKLHALPIRLLLAAVLAAGLIPATAQAICIPFYCPDCDLRSQGQLNLVVMDRENGEITLVPNIRVTGPASDFALVIPTPTIPTFTEADHAIWNEAFALTAPAPPSRISSASDGLGCGSDIATSPPVFADDAGGEDDREVFIETEQTVGSFLVTVISSTDPDALIDWLVEQGYVVSAQAAARFAPYVERGWVFTAMKLNLDDPELDLPDGAWNADVNPVELHYAAETFEVPMPLLQINQAEWMALSFFVLDDHRTDLEGFTTSYANRITTGEYREIRERHPALAEHLAAGKFLTRLDLSLWVQEPMTASVPLVRAASDAEFRRTGWGGGWFLGSLPASVLGLFLTVGLGARWITRRTAKKG